MANRYYTDSMKSWLDRVVQFVGRRKLTIESQSASQIVATVTREEGTVTQEGDVLDATNLNALENRIDEAFTAVQSDIDEVSETSEATADKLDVLWKLSKGIIYDWQTTNVDGTVTVPSGAKSSVLQGLKGKSIVDDNELKSVDVTKFTVNGKNLFDVTANPTIDSTYRWYLDIIPKGLTVRMTLVDKDATVDISGCYIGFGHNMGNVPLVDYTWVISNGSLTNKYTNVAAYGDIGSLLRSVVVFPRTNETFTKLTSRYNIQIEVGTEATEYVPYVEPIDYPITFTGKSAGTVRDEIDLVNKKYIQRVGVVDLGTLTWTNTEYVGYSIFRTVGITDAYRHPIGAEYEHQINSNGYTSVTTISTSTADMSIIINSNATSSNRTYIRDNRYATPEEFKEAMNGVMLYYELATPIETEITEEEITAITASGDTIVFDGDIEVGSVFSHFIALNEVNV